MPFLGDPATMALPAQIFSFYRSQESVNEPALHAPVIGSDNGTTDEAYSIRDAHLNMARAAQVPNSGVSSSRSSFIAAVPPHSIFHIANERISIQPDMTDPCIFQPFQGRGTARNSPPSSVLGIFPDRVSQPYANDFSNGPLGELKENSRYQPNSPAPQYLTDSEQSRRKIQDEMSSPRQKQLKRVVNAKNVWASSIRNHILAVIGEIFGTAMFLFFGFASILVANASIQDDKHNDTASPQILRFLFISLGFGMSFAVNLWIFARISGAMLNPAITLAMAIVQEISAVRAVVCFVAQMLGGFLGSGLIMALFPSPLELVRTRLSHGTTLVQGVFMEALMTAELVTVVLMLAKERYQRNVIAAIAIGSSVFMAHLIGMPYTGVGMNPVRSFAPNVITASFDKDHWVYWIGPLIGSLLAVSFYKLSNLVKDDDGHLQRPRLDLMV